MQEIALLKDLGDRNGQIDALLTLSEMHAEACLHVTAVVVVFVGCSCGHGM